MLNRAPDDTTVQEQLALADIRLLAVETAVPPFRCSQDEALRRARGLFPDFEHLDSVFVNTGIDTRYSCVPLDWFYEEHGWTDRNEVFRSSALDLLEQAARGAMSKAGISASEVGAIVTVSTTGIAVPSLDSALLHRLGLSKSTERLPIFGLGCAGGVSGLARATRLAASFEDKVVLMLCVELCTLNFRKGGPSPKLNFVATALFGDGAAAIIVGHEPGGHAQGVRPCQIEATGEHNWPDTEPVMGWSIEPDGFGVVMSTQIPKFARENLRDAVDHFLECNGFRVEDLDGVIAHPGGRKVLEAMSGALDRPEESFRHSWDTLRDHGNMSSPTVLFVLQRTMAEAPKGRHLMLAFGPGFTVSFALLNFGGLGDKQ